MINNIEVTKHDKDSFVCNRNYGGGPISTQEGFDYLVKSKRESKRDIMIMFTVMADSSHNYINSGLCVGCLNTRDEIFFHHIVECYIDKKARLEKEGKWEVFLQEEEEKSKIYED